MHHNYWFAGIFGFFVASVMSDKCFVVMELASNGSTNFTEGCICGVHYECNGVRHFLCVGLAISGDVDDELAESMDGWNPLHF